MTWPFRFNQGSVPPLTGLYLSTDFPGTPEALHLLVDMAQEQKGAGASHPSWKVITLTRKYSAAGKGKPDLPLEGRGDSAVDPQGSYVLPPHPHWDWDMSSRRISV